MASSAPPPSDLRCVLLTDKTLDVNRAIAAVSDPKCGAISTFIGMTRVTAKTKEVQTLIYEGYEEMASQKIGQACDEVLRDYPLISKIAVEHKLGSCPVGSFGVVVCVSAPHRRDAITACHALIDKIKGTVPIWKKEVYEDGSSWVENLEWNPEEVVSAAATS